VKTAIANLKSYSRNRKRPLPTERLELVMPAELKTQIHEHAQKEKLPMQVFVRLVLEKYMNSKRLQNSNTDDHRERMFACAHSFPCDCGHGATNYKGK
jgi:hypothetical protein